MSRVDRRVQKSQEAIKNAFIELMTEKSFDHITIQDISDRANVGRRTIYDHYMDKFDLLDKLIEEHINQLRILCASASELNFVEGNLIWFEYFERNHSFFSTMLTSKGAPAFRSHFLEFVIQELEGEVDVTEGKNQGLSKDLILKFFGAAIVEIVEVWFNNGLSEPTQVVAEQVGLLLDRNL
ncbi:TetR/AcrR family transcriptional regulator [Peribacillus frigoritolerans]|uniref:TetR/AcrR family transcriptional regulator n=1 Tax=Peribacillus frigoritolerans TaxID=450367 RepID=UPI000BEB54C1|nr:TetR/AcrR family transcriptional regulator [Peribacillus frigoritolerans]MBD8137815.1 TetR/AcrR family transcriptional regulator C-terminal domain-containing protein [Bacillus sp. CFBP 13597]PEF38440.1 TetR family transcriptional regulator [Bacillus sp. AFS094228]PEO44125.1 TetR family transcriptional regulator [Bacillus sp. AFS026049]MCR8871739.1 TetR/AcrR family transcriptional regulator [Peribacillus frigoritolerans]MED3835322.1 TetR/AcrR family transcriptional regulator [Peribacillus fr